MDLGLLRRRHPCPLRVEHVVVVFVLLEPSSQLKAGRREQAAEQWQGRLLPISLDARHRGLRDAGPFGELSLREAASHPRQTQEISREMLTVSPPGRSHGGHGGTIANPLSHARLFAIDNPDHDLYDSYMTELAVSEARDRFADAIEQARRSGEPVYVTRRGRRVAVIVDAEAYERVVEAAEDAEDRRELQAARAEDDYVPWDEVKADLGLA